MPSYTGLRTKETGQVTKIETSIAQRMAKEYPDQYELVALEKITVTAPKQAAPCKNCGK